MEGKLMRGQVAIIVLLISAVMLTLGLSLSTKETADIKISTNEELLKKAFDTAESGINYYLGTGGTAYSDSGKTSFANISATKISDGSNKVDFGEYTPEGSTEYYWLINHLDNGDIGGTFFAGPNVDICSNNFAGSATLDFFYKTGSNYKVKRLGYNYGVTNTVNGFGTASGGCATVDIVGVGATPVLVAVTPIYEGGKFYAEAKSGGSFVSQGVDITSSGQAGGTATGSNAQAIKKLNVRLRYKLPGFMVSGMMAEGSILSD